MIRLNLKREAFWLDLIAGVRVKVRPATTALAMAVRFDTQTMTPLGDLPPMAERSAENLKAMARHAIIEWEGVGDADGNPVPVTPEGVNALMDLSPVADAFSLGYVAPALTLDLEKNV